jgi:hypothetical protein
MGDIEYLKFCFGTGNIDKINEFYIKGYNFSANEKEWDIIKAPRFSEGREN